MEQLVALFSSAPLPYKFIKIPPVEAPPVLRARPLKLFVNKVITVLTSDSFSQSGFEITTNESAWNASWGRQFVLLRYSTVKPWQKCNHFAGAFLLGRKDHFHRRMAELKERVGDFASFYQESYLLPDQADDLASKFRNHKLWIIKPAAESQGNGISLINSELSPVPTGAVIAQVYVERPLLITGRKFDIRLYVIVTSVAPLRIYIHDSGLIRFATHQYDPNADITDLHAHLTNFSVNKDDEKFVRCAEDHDESVDDSKWSLPFFKLYCQNNGIDFAVLWKEFERVTTATIIAGMSVVKNHHQRYVKHRHSCYESMGIDILVDENMKASVLEVNISPGMSGKDSKLDYQIKSRLMHDILEMARIIDCDVDSPRPCPGIEEVDCLCSVPKDRCIGVRSGRVNPWENPVFADFMMVRDFVEEKGLLTGYHRTFPKRKTLEQYWKCVDMPGYADFVLREWVKLSKQDRVEVIERNFSSYAEKLAKIRADVGFA
jgi:tubulin polyglutamylase TTLL4